MTPAKKYHRRLVEIAGKYDYFLTRQFYVFGNGAMKPTAWPT